VLNIYVDTPAFFIRPNTNTDWRYMRQLRRISEHVEARFLYPIDFNDILYENVNVIAKAIIGRVLNGYSRYNPGLRARTISADRVARSGADIIYSHRHQLPANSGPAPMIWFYGVADPKMLMANGVSESEIAAQYEAQAKNYRRATKVQVTSEAEVKRHASRFPELADRFASVPWFRPGLSPIPASQAREKHSDDQIVRLLFIGRQARRKGLDILLDAIRLMNDAERKRLSLDIVSSFSDGPVDLDVDVDFRCHKEIDNPTLFNLIHRAHVYAMPCRFETFGLVFVEAMSQGCAVLGPDWEVQREILDYGGAGINSAANPESVCGGLRRLCFDRITRATLAQSGIERFVGKYSPQVVARSYMTMFESAIDARRN